MSRRCKSVDGRLNSPSSVPLSFEVSKLGSKRSLSPSIFAAVVNETAFEEEEDRDSSQLLEGKQMRTE